MLKIYLKKWIFLLFPIIFSLLLGLKTGAKFFFLIFWFLVSGVAASLIWVSIEYFATQIHLIRKIPEKVIKGDTLEVEAIVQNKGVLPVFNIVVEDDLSCAVHLQDKKQKFLVEYLAAKAKLELRYKCLCPQRGFYEIGPFTVYFFDPLGLVYLRKKYYLYSGLYVYPKVFNIKKFPKLTKGVMPWFGIDSSRSAGDDDEFFGIREYRSGDAFKKIHWFSSARQHKLIVRQFQRQNFYRATILFNLNKDLDFGRLPDTVSEYIITIAASVTKYLVEQGVSVELIAQAGEFVHIQPNKGQQHLDSIFKFLTLAKAESKVGLGEIFEDFSHHIPDDSNLIVIMLDKDWDNLATMVPLEKRNISLIPLIIVSSTFIYSVDKQAVVKDVEHKLSEAYNIYPIMISRGDNLEEIFLKV